MDNIYYCSECNILLYEPYQMNCGHRICEICFYKQKVNRCIKCNEEKIHSFKDIGLKNYLVNKFFKCSICFDIILYENYKYHLDTIHSNIICITCDKKIFVSDYHDHISKCVDIKSVELVKDNKISDDISRLSKDYIDLLEDIDAIQETVEETILHANVINVNENILALQSTEVDDMYDYNRYIRNTNNDGHYIWKIKNFINDNIPYTTMSPTFTSSVYGYNFKLNLIVETEQLYIILYIMKGEYDNVIQFPYRHESIICLYNPINRKDDVYKKTIHREFTSINRPEYYMNTCYGRIAFDIETLKAKNFIKDNTIYIGHTVYPIMKYQYEIMNKYLPIIMSYYLSLDISIPLFVRHKMLEHNFDRHLLVVMLNHEVNKIRNNK